MFFIPSDAFSNRLLESRLSGLNDPGFAGMAGGMQSSLLHLSPVQLRKRSTVSAEGCAGSSANYDYYTICQQCCRVMYARC
jgi:hypothetical protein